MYINCNTYTILLLIVLCSCTGVQKQGNNNENIQASKNMDMIEEKTIIFRTSDKVDNLVPIVVNDNNEIVSYPAPSDLKIDGKYKKPIALGNNWYIDQIGVSSKSKFLTLSFKEYAVINPVNIDNLQSKVTPISFYDICECPPVDNYDEIITAFNDGKLNQYIGYNCKTVFTKRVPASIKKN